MEHPPTSGLERSVAMHRALKINHPAPVPFPTVHFYDNACSPEQYVDEEPLPVDPQLLIGRPAAQPVGVDDVKQTLRRGPRQISRLEQEACPLGVADPPPRCLERIVQRRERGRACPQRSVDRVATDLGHKLDRGESWAGVGHPGLDLHEFEGNLTPGEHEAV